jgi:uncharacterized membrane protein YqaE (UPF0057 family)
MAADLDICNLVGELPYAFMAGIATSDTVVSNPMLTIARETGLSLDVDNDGSDYEHTFSGCLLSYGEPVLYREVKILVNGTVKANLTTVEPDGSFSLTLNLQPADNKPTTYNTQAVFDGDEPCSATAYGYTLNGTEYSVCTTIQYGFKPASNATWLTVTPQSTEVATPTKTPEELQQEAEDSGWLTIWHEFSWWYPWYRLHFVYLSSGVMQFDVGISLLPFGDIIEYAEGFIQKTVDLLPRVSWKIVTGLATAEFTALLASAGGPGFFLLALGLSIGTKAAAAIASWNSIDDLISVFFGVFIPTVVSMVKTGIWDLFLNVLYLLTQIKSLAEVGFGKLYSMISIPLNIAYLGQIVQRLDELGAF